MKWKYLHFVFLDFEKAFDQVHENDVWWALRKLGIDKLLVKIVQAMFINAESRVRVNTSFIKIFLMP